MIVESLTPLLNVEDVAASIEFYRNALAFTVEKSVEEGGKPIWALLRHGEITLMLNRPNHADSAPRRDQASYREAVFYFRVPDIHAAHTELVERGYQPGEVQHMDYGVNEFLMRDPDGYELAFGAEIAG